MSIHPDFEPAIRTGSLQRLTRPSLSYWEDVWIRLKKNRQAIASLYLVGILLIFSFFGPFVWTVDPALQNLNRVSEGPSLGRQAIVVDDTADEQTIEDANFPYLPENDNPSIGAPEKFEVVGTPSTLGVEIHWSPVEGAAGYLIYRSQKESKSLEEISNNGVVIKEVGAGNEIGFIDRFDIQPMEYWYAVVAKSVETVSTQSKIINVKVVRAIGLESAQSESKEPVKVGDNVTLAIHPLGTDYLGRDMLARLMYGGRISLIIGIFVPLIYILFGALYGGLSGFLGGRIDNIMMRISDIVATMPYLLVVIILYILLGGNVGTKSVFALMVAMTSMFWPGTARLIRGQVLQIREEGYVQASKLLGSSTIYIILRHMIPNTMGLILVNLTFAVPSSIFSEAFMAFIGMGVKPPFASWGSLCEEGVKTMTSSPHELFWPALFISLTTLAFNLLGDGLRDATDSKMRSRE